MNRTTLPIALTLLLIAATIPHTIEDFRYGEFARFGVSTSTAGVALVIVYAVQLIGMILAVRGERSGFWLLAACGVLWCVGASIVHGSELFGSGAYRNGFESKALIVAIIVLGAATAVVSLRSGRDLSRPPRH
ncbi:MAG TPA: hypothetical protein VEV38_11225 [Candidatus Eremiobacteraceae bacterium]|nr:hypothetical protein [Candidatus Eremiobacteraceae bacterium]